LELAAAFKTSTKTIDRCNHIAEIDGVPVPWENPAALAEWYGAHYRSDSSMPPPTKTRKPPPWILDALHSVLPQAVGPTLVPDIVPISFPTFPNPELPSPTDSNTEDPLVTAEEMLKNILERYSKAKLDPAQSYSLPTMERNYFAALTAFQQAQERARKSGDADARMLQLINDRIDAIHRKLPRHLAEEMLACRREVLAAASSRETFAEFCRHFFAAVGSRLETVAFQLAS
jgi:hypothetical protein